MVSEKWDENTEAVVEIFSEVPNITNDNTDRFINIDGLIKGSQKNYDMDDLYANVRKIDIVHKDFMKALGKVYVGGDYILAKLELGDLAEKYLNDFYVHPVYLDSSTLLPFLSLEGSQTGRDAQGAQR
jgi:hypothetical protein